MMQLKSLFVLFCLLLTACASAPKLSELRTNINSATFVQHGKAPLSYSLGVVDAASFWGQYGSGVAAQTGGLLWEGLAEAGSATSADKADQNTLLMKRFYGDHSMMQSISKALMPKLAHAWRVPFSANKVHVVEENALKVEPETQFLQGAKANSDLILLLDIAEISLTERFSVGGAFKAGFTMGTHEKSLTTTATVRMRAFKRDAASGKHKQIWAQLCGADGRIGEVTRQTQAVAG